MAETRESTKPLGKRLGQGWFWISQVTSVIGLISILDDLKLWLAVLAWLMALIRSVVPLLSDILREMGSAIGIILDVFRRFFRPIVEFLLQWLPFQISDLIKDALIVAVFVGLGWLRNRIAFHWEYFVAMEEEGAALLASMRRAGIACEAEDAPIIRQAIFSRRTLEERKVPPDLRMRLQNHWDEARSKYGEPLEAFVDAHPELRRSSSRTWKLFDREERADKLVWGLGAFTAALVVLDHLYMR